MRSVSLLPYCPWPADTGTKVEMMKHLNVLKELGACTIASARSRPVGFGWSAAACRALGEQGFTVVLREDSEGLRCEQLAGLAYAAVCKGLRFEKAFGHRNPYHRFAFSAKWWRRVAHGHDLAVMHYGFWARFPAPCPTAIVVHELLSNFHRGGATSETREFMKADLLLVVGQDEKQLLESRGLRNVQWSPPAVQAVSCPLTPRVGLIGTVAPQNLEGLRWLESAGDAASPEVRVYGNLAQAALAPFMVKVGRYDDQYTPYQECGIALMTRDDRPGLQIKVVEALACGRAIIARKGSMRGLPDEKGCWIEVETPAEMLAAAGRLQRDEGQRRALAAAAKEYYRRYLDHDTVIANLKSVYLGLAGSPATAGRR